MEFILPGLMIWSVFYGLYLLGKAIEWLETGPQALVIHVHNHPVQRDVYIERIIEKESRVYIR